MDKNLLCVSKGGGVMERLTKKGFNFTTDFIKRDIDSWSISQCLKKLQEYEDLEEQGRLIKFPCKVGDMLYYPDKEFNIIIPVRLTEIVIKFNDLDTTSCQYNCCSFDECGDFYEDYEFDANDFGKSVFLTKSEAEAKLKELRGGE